MSQSIEQGKWCVYIGPGDGRLSKHRVIEVTPRHVITWSMFGNLESPKNLAENGWSWMGPQDQFIKQFRPCVPAEIP